MEEAIKEWAWNIIVLIKEFKSRHTALWVAENNTAFSKWISFIDIQLFPITDWLPYLDKSFFLWFFQCVGGYVGKSYVTFSTTEIECRKSQSCIEDAYPIHLSVNIVK